MSSKKALEQRLVLLNEISAEKHVIYNGVIIREKDLPKDVDLQIAEDERLALELNNQMNGSQFKETRQMIGEIINDTVDLDIKEAFVPRSIDEGVINEPKDEVLPDGFFNEADDMERDIRFSIRELVETNSRDYNKFTIIKNKITELNRIDSQATRDFVSEVNLFAQQVRTTVKYQNVFSVSPSYHASAIHIVKMTYTDNFAEVHSYGIGFTIKDAKNLSARLFVKLPFFVNLYNLFVHASKKSIMDQKSELEIPHLKKETEKEVAINQHFENYMVKNTKIKKKGIHVKDESNAEQQEEDMSHLFDKIDVRNTDYVKRKMFDDNTCKIHKKDLMALDSLIDFCQNFANTNYSGSYQILKIFMPSTLAILVVNRRIGEEESESRYLRLLGDSIIKTSVIRSIGKKLGKRTVDIKNRSKIIHNLVSNEYLATILKELYDVIIDFTFMKNMHLGDHLLVDHFEAIIGWMDERGYLDEDKLGEFIIGNFDIYQ
jgi:23S rRNA maturation mini-RNase III